MNHQILAQKPYKSKGGLLVAKALNDYEATNHRFEDVTVILDYDRAEVEIRLTPKISKPDSVFSIDTPLELKLSLSIPRIETQPHPDQYFFTRGKLKYGAKSLEIHGTGELEHQQGGETFSCSLMLSLKLPRSGGIHLDGIGDIIELYLHQMVLHPDF